MPDQFALETEARISPLINEKRRLFNDLLTAKGNIKIYCCARPLFEDEGSSIVEYPDDYNIRVNTGDDALSNPKKDFKLDRVYGPHVGQAELFRDVQPLVQSALDGYNVSIFAYRYYRQTNSGKTYIMVALFSSFPPSAFVCVSLPECVSDVYKFVHVC
ncbi:kinesin-like protein KIN-14B isoform X3 [Prunus yedoensis var. nudiflora]|uniref:Kinesin-like protein KIN-14B isoform X3 n=1 Tax=Prunus yedoensis var. nudiflora TaxID=2094558 RepID=A0A314Z2T5_PRUYE|nr:kinesin-like protein KIN-14B isoform X3 [Prunus yedoensis var. nudiflora]